MANTKDFFLTVTQRLFSNWTALKLAVEHGMGSRECAIDFCSYVTEMMYMNEKLDNSDIAGELEEYLDVNFNTELEDNSSIEVADALLRFHGYCMQGNEAVATEELNKLPPLQPWISTVQLIREKIHEPSTTADQEEEKANSDMDDDRQMDTVDDDWVKVKTRRKN